MEKQSTTFQTLKIANIEIKLSRLTVEMRKSLFHPVCIWQMLALFTKAAELQLCP